MNSKLAVPTRLRVVAGDPGYKNFGVCILELTHVGWVVGVDGPRTRTPIPFFRILDLGVMNLTTEVPEVSVSVDDAPDDSDMCLADLHAHMTSEKALDNNLPMWRKHLAQRMSSQFPVLHERYDCPLTGRKELPAAAFENQLDVSRDEEYDHTVAAEARQLREATDAAKAAARIKQDLALPVWVSNLVALAGKGRVQLKPKDEFIRARMYTLGQVFAGALEAIDEHAGARDRLIINAAKKHRIASNGALTYPQRKAAAVALMRAMLQEQSDNGSTVEEIEHGDHWLEFLDEQLEAGQKLDDFADAFLLAIEVAMRLHKKFYKKLRPEALKTMQCYAPVTNDELRDAAAGTPAALATPTVTKKKRAPRKKPAAAKAPPAKKTATLAKKKKATTPSKRKRAAADSLADSSADSESSTRLVVTHKPRASKKLKRASLSDEDDPDDGDYGRHT